MKPLSPTGISRQNNFDLLRLLSALQVVVLHLNHYQRLNPLPSFLHTMLGYFPGIIIFFIISGFLIFAAYDRNRDLARYFRNRLLRIFPALWVACAILFALMLSAGYLMNNDFTTIKWIVGQLTVFQLYQPEKLREYSGYVPNPSLWTIPIEFSFYVFVPVLFWIFRKIKIMSMTALITLFIVCSFIFNYYLLTVSRKDMELFSLLNKNFFPYLFYFLLGSLSYLHFDKLKKIYLGKGFYWLAFYMCYILVAGAYLDLYEPENYTNGFGLIGAIILSQMVISLAYTLPQLSGQLLKGNDLSYGLYLYHMIVINVFNRNGYTGNNFTFLPVILISLAMAYLSWIMVERPAIALKFKTQLPQEEIKK